MPTRQLKPGFKDSRRIAACSWPAQSLFVRLLTLVDDFGRYEAHPTLLSSVAFPFGRPDGRRVREQELGQWLAELEKNDLLTRYSADGAEYLELKRWTERVRAEKSRFPPPTLAVAGNCQHAAGNCCQPLAIAASPTTTPTTTPTTIKERERPKNSQPKALESRTRWGALTVRIKELAAVAREERTPEQRAELEELKKKRSALEAQQRKGEFE